MKPATSNAKEPRQGALVITCGLPASGKSTWANRQPNAVVLSSDRIRTTGANASIVFGSLYAQARSGLLAGATVIVDVCALRPADRLEWLRFGRGHGARCEIVCFEVAPDVCRKRDSVRAYPTLHFDWNRSGRLVQIAHERVRHEGWDRVSWVRLEDQRA